ncbi:30S ribosomal protein S9 [Candidatus Woesearchaeota archaeon]|nr:30S ribosomal protein S9 [Candidatus Woesearchaeota archaeon]
MSKAAAKPKGKVVHISGKRKRAIARATIREGKGVVRINSMLLDHVQPELVRAKIMEPLILAGDEIMKNVNIHVNWRGGGIVSGAEAVRLVIAKGLVAFTGKKDLRQRFLEYDRHLLVADVRRNEPHKPGDSKPRANRQKSYR